MLEPTRAPDTRLIADDEGSPRLSPSAGGHGTDSTTRTLHVIESFGSGSLSALLQYVRSTPHLEHHLLRRVRTTDYVPDGELSLFASVHELPASPLTWPRALRSVVRSVEPEIVHAHSSFAGLFTRLSIRTRAERRIVYTPHCFAFERRDVGRTKRTGFLFAEWLLALNTDTIVGCSEFEAERSARWRTCRRAVYVPNYSPSPASSAGSAVVTGGEIVGVGRVVPQKDPEFFAGVIDALRGAEVPSRAVWIGSGEAQGVRTLNSSGVEVTGWLARSHAQARLEGAQVYVHTAQWEGFPMSVLEAAAAGVPIVARRIGAFSGAPERWLGETPEQLAALVELVRGSAEQAESNRREWAEFLATNSRESQLDRLTQAYRVTQRRTAGALRAVEAL